MNIHKRVLAHNLCIPSYHNLLNLDSLLLLYLRVDLMQLCWSNSCLLFVHNPNTSSKVYSSKYGNINL